MDVSLVRRTALLLCLLPLALTAVLTGDAGAQAPAFWASSPSDMWTIAATAFGAHGYARRTGMAWGVFRHAPRCVASGDGYWFYNGESNSSIWAPAGNDFYLVDRGDDAGQFRIVRVLGDVVQVVYDRSAAAR